MSPVQDLPDRPVLSGTSVSLKLHLLFLVIIILCLLQQKHAHTKCPSHRKEGRRCIMLLVVAAAFRIISAFSVGCIELDFPP